VILLLFSLLTSGFGFDIKGIFVALYFAVWIAAVVFVVMTYIIPMIKDRQKKAKNQVKKGSTGVVSPPPFKSPRSGLPLRDRVAAYVAERRKEDGLQTPQPLRPSRTVSSKSGGSSSGYQAGTSTPSSISASSSAGIAGAAVSSLAPEPCVTGTGGIGEDLGDLPLPDDFGSVDDAGTGMDSLPGLDGDIDDLSGFDGGGDITDDFVVDDGIDDTGGFPEEPVSGSSSQDFSGGELPGLDDDLDAGFDGSDFISDDGMMDLSSGDILTMDDEESMEPVLSPSSGDEGTIMSDGLSEDGLPDLDETLEPDILDSDLSGDEDFGDIEFDDLEPEEPKKAVK